MQKSFLYLLLGLAFSLSPTLAQAQAAKAPSPAPTPIASPVISGKTLAGTPFDLAKLKGQVVMLMFWSTSCAVCRDKMPELRENAKGWAGKPFVPVLVSVDKRMSDIDSYNAIINASVPMKERLMQVWALDPGYKDNLGTMQTAQTVPASYWPVIIVLDKEGKVAVRHQGRMPADVWDDIAGLL